MSKSVIHIVFCFALAYCLVWCGDSYGQSTAPAPIVDPLTEMGPAVEDNGEDILNMDIDKLSTVAAVVPAFDIEVSSVSKQESTIGKSPAAVYVITNEMIHRSGATCIPEALRLAPGVQVARINSHTWAISIRGFNDRYNNKLLVLVDGRSVYSPLLSGTFWDEIDMPLEDIERIEVIRGPGGTLWGANAVNGVINIISKKAKDTQGALVSSGGGSQSSNISTVRYGGCAGRNIKYRVWGKYVERGPEDSAWKYDDWRQGRGGFYADWNPRGSRNDLINFQGNFYGGREGTRFDLLPSVPATPVTVASNRVVSENTFLARWTHTIDDESDWALQAYYDHVVRNDPQVLYTSNTFDVDFQYRRPFGQRHSVITGVEFRQTQDFTGTPYVTMRWDPSARLYSMISGFIQDEIELVDDKFYLTLGSKFESNSFTGFEYQPSIRGLWALDDRHVAWGAVSRAVRTPNRFDENGASRGFWSPTPLLTYGSVRGNPNIKSEDVIAYELGYRAQASKRFSWDIALFYNQYENLMASTFDSAVVAPPYLYPYYTTKNCGRGYAYGFEWTANWEATKTWRLAGSYSFLVDSTTYTDPNHTGQRIIPVVGNSLNDPRNQVSLQSYWSFAPNWQLDSFLRYVDSLSSGAAPAYITMDVRLGWRPRKNLEFSIVGQNLFAPSHLEFAPNFKYGETTCEINRAVFAKMTWTR
jgi:iron complex outermembrane receptor protein